MPVRPPKRKSKRKSHLADPPRNDSSSAVYTLNAGTKVEIRKRGEKHWKPHAMSKTVTMRTVKRSGSQLYLSFLSWEVRYTSTALVTDKRFKRY